MQRAAAAALAALLLTHPAGASALGQGPTLKVLLARIAGQVAQFKAEFSLIVGVEHYDQLQRTADGRTRTRHLVSDVFFYRPESTGPAMTVRTVRRVDGRPTDTSGDRIADALALPGSRRLEQLRALADSGALYNLGNLQRNFNEPTVALTFAAPDFQPRFKFALDGTEDVNGELLQRVKFSEVDRPTIIRDAQGGANIPASGRLWTSDDGVIRQTELHLETRRDTLVNIRVSYGVDERLGVMVPVSMDEDYRYRDRDRDNQRFVFITGHAVYSDYRRFETSGRVVTP
jgi:hypothetical protein